MARSARAFVLSRGERVVLARVMRPSTSEQPAGAAAAQGVDVAEAPCRGAARQPV